MTSSLTGPTDERLDRRQALGATGLLADFNRAGVLNAADVHVARRLGSILGEQRDVVLLAAALAVRAVRHGSVCVDLATVADQALQVAEEDDPATDLTWPEAGSWVGEVAASALVAEQVLRLEDSRLYLDRYWREECQVVEDLVARLDREAPDPDPRRVTSVLDRVMPRDDVENDYTEQRDAVEAAARQWTTVLTGGPGTGKTTTVAALLALVAELHEEAHDGQPPRIALCAPTGKAAARLQEAVADAAGRIGSGVDRARVSGLEAVTLHRLLGWRPDSAVRFRHHRSRRLPYDVVVVDETSMVSLTMMARLLEAVRPDARLVLVGDADQLSSVEAGAVLADLVEGLESHRPDVVRRLRVTHRYGEQIGGLAEALRVGDADQVMAVLAAGSDEVVLIDPADEAAMERFRASVADVAHALRVAADAGDDVAALQALEEHRLLCAHREGPFGVGGWNRLVEQLVAERTEGPTYDEWYSGRPVLVTANDRGQRLSNGDMGVTMRREDGRLRVALAGQGRSLAPTRLPDVQTMHALTVHKSQGSQATTVSVVLPDEQSRLLTRELFYTAVTRARKRVRIVGSEAAIRAAVGREVQRASGLRERLQAALGMPPPPD